VFVATRYGSLLGLAYLLTQDRGLAEDLVQSALTRCWLSWRRIRAEDPSAYVRRVLINTHTEWWRRRKHGMEVPVPADRLVEAQEPADSSTGLIEQAELLAALRTLPRKMCAVVVLRYFEDLSEAETAEVMGCSLGTVKSQAHRALKKLQVELAHLQTEEGR
jgi:RNA polymerase sigma-70 factor (sigma-E family)